MAQCAPLKGRELVADDVKYAYEAYAKEGVQSFTFQEIDGMETPDKYTICIHLKTPNTMFPQNVAEPVTVIFAREVLEEDGDLKKRMIGTGPFILKENERKVRAVLARNPDYFDKGFPYIDEYRILSTPDAATRLAAFRTGQSDILGLQSLADVATVLRTNPKAVVQETTTTLTPFGLTLRMDKPPGAAGSEAQPQHCAEESLTQRHHRNGPQDTPCACQIGCCKVSSTRGIRNAVWHRAGVLTPARR
jgi:peptide/nickel transport system substrate-binding protein